MICYSNISADSRSDLSFLLQLQNRQKKVKLKRFESEKKDPKKIMGWKCSAPGCQAGYSREPPDPDSDFSISFHKFPNFTSSTPNNELQALWLKSIPRDTTN